MNTYWRVCAIACLLGAMSAPAAHGDVIIDWNKLFCEVMQEDGILNIDSKANPGWSTRSAAMLNGAMYDAFQAVERTHKPFAYNQMNTVADKQVAAAQAAYEILLHCYPLRNDMLQAQLDASLGAVSDGPGKQAGIDLGKAVAQHYINMRSSDNSATQIQWPEGTQPGEWRSDPISGPQVAWGPAWGSVTPFAIPSTSYFSVPGPPALGSQEYVDAYNEVMNYGANSTYGPDNTPTSRTAEQTEIALFWAYDRASMGPPPVMFLESVGEIAKAVGTSPEDNARLFALASIAMADAATAAWDIKFIDNFWRPVTGIREGDADGNPLTVGDPNWAPLGAPGAIHNDPNNPDMPGGEDDFTPPFPSYTSGHATMGGALFKAIELFFGTNSFEEADAMFGNDPVTATYTLFSEEEGGGGARIYNSFTQTGPIGIGLENSPEGENATSRVYLGVHWMFDQIDGNYLGNDIASYIYSNYMVAVPEPSTLLLAGSTLVVAWGLRRRSVRRCPARSEG
jgi:hypothetical protein